jgi:phospholipid/cholesterol/gamma-HCH transport system substrate-binding protein
VLLISISAPFSHSFIVKAYFTNAMGLQAGAVVRLAGVDIGSVKSVRARPELKETPVEVVMALRPAYELNLPNDSNAMLETAGVLGETYVEIDASSAVGPPITTNGILKTKPTVTLNTQQVLEKLTEHLNQGVDNLSKQIEKCGGSNDLRRDKDRTAPKPPHKLTPQK